MRLPALLVASALLAAGCAAPAADLALTTPPAHALAQAAGVPLSSDASTPSVEWKERLPVRYAYVEAAAAGGFDAAMRRLLGAAAAARLDATGPPFGLFAADGGARACLPVDGDPSAAGLATDLLPGAVVAYAVVAGPYPEARRARPGVARWIEDRGWRVAGAVREVYLVDPGAVADPGALATEVQIPWTR